jgi:phosphoribosylformylglycinamidine (FGAM) synthase-like amidotransferase family enzyme
MYCLFLYIFPVSVSGAICTYPQEHKLQSTAIGVCNGCGMLVHWSKYWLGHPHTF